MSTVYTPQAGSFVWKVVQYFTTWPDDRLDASQLGAKFDVPRRQVHTLLGPAIEAGCLKREEDTTELVYMRGKGHPSIPASKADHPKLPTGSADPSILVRPTEPPAAAAPAKRRPAFYIDTAALELQDDIPLPGKTNPLAVDWEGLFNRMKPGQSVALPSEGVHAAKKAISVFNRKDGEQVSLRQGETEFRIWKVGRAVQSS